MRSRRVPHAKRSVRSAPRNVFQQPLKGVPTAYGPTTWRNTHIPQKLPALGSGKGGRAVALQGIGTPTLRRRGPVIR